MAELLTLYEQNPNEKYLQKAASALEMGGLLIYPTDTVYALGCLTNKPQALARYEALKGVRLAQAPLSFLFSSISELSQYVAPIENDQFRMLNRYLPGPFAFIMQAAKKLPEPFEKRKTIGCRIVSHPVIEKLLPLLSAPLLTSSIHDPDEVIDYTTDPEELFLQWNDKIDLMIACGYGGNNPSTVVDLTVEPFEVVRQGTGIL